MGMVCDGIKFDGIAWDVVLKWSGKKVGVGMYASALVVMAWPVTVVVGRRWGPCSCESG
jgi:hypothetical protein